MAYGSYDGGLRELIHLLKYEQVRPAAAVLGRMLAEAVSGIGICSGSSGRWLSQCRCMRGSYASAASTSPS